MPAGDEQLRDALERSLGGTVQALRPLSGGASRLTSSFDLVASDGTAQALIVQVDRGSSRVSPSSVEVEARLLDAASRAGVPVARLVATGRIEDTGQGWLVVERLDGEVLARRLLRDDAWRGARAALAGQCGAALAAIHRIDPATIPGLATRDPVSDPLGILDSLGMVRPVLELGVRWLARHRPDGAGRVTVHGDFRLGNLLCDGAGLRAVLDWELAHAGDPGEDLGWLCARAWRFGGELHVGGFGDLDVLLDAYAVAGGRPIEPATVRYWEAAAAVRWAVICAMQASAHLSGATRSVELASIGRRVVESEWDLLEVLAVTDGAGAAAPPRRAAPTRSPFARPSAEELVAAVGELVDRQVTDAPPGAQRFEWRVAHNALGIVARELRDGPWVAEVHAACLERLAVADDAALAAVIRDGHMDDRLEEVGRVLATSTSAQLEVDNPTYASTAVT